MFFFFTSICYRCQPLVAAKEVRPLEPSENPSLQLLKKAPYRSQPLDADPDGILITWDLHDDHVVGLFSRWSKFFP